MWTIFKFDKRQFHLLENEIKNKLGNDFIIYWQQILIKKKSKNKLIKKELDILGDYLFCFHQELKKNKIIENLKFCKGIKHFIYGYKETQKEIVDFINKCKKNENSDGYISNDFLELLVGSNYKFVSGPFSNKIFKLLEINKFRLRIALGHIKTTFERNKFLINPV